MAGRVMRTTAATAVLALMAGPALAQWEFVNDDDGGVSATVFERDDDRIWSFSIGCDPGETGLMTLAILMNATAESGPDRVPMTLSVGGDEFTFDAVPAIWSPDLVPLFAEIAWEGELQDELRAKIKSGNTMRLSGEGLAPRTFGLRGSGNAVRSLEAECPGVWASAPPDPEPEPEPDTRDQQRFGDWLVERDDEASAALLIEDGRAIGFECEASNPGVVEISFIVEGRTDAPGDTVFAFDIEGEEITGVQGGISQLDDARVQLVAGYTYNDVVEEILLEGTAAAQRVGIAAGEGYEGFRFDVGRPAAAISRFTENCVALGAWEAAAPVAPEEPAEPEPPTPTAARLDWEIVLGDDSHIVVVNDQRFRSFALNCRAIEPDTMRLLTFLIGEVPERDIVEIRYLIDDTPFDATADIIPDEDGTILLLAPYPYDADFERVILDGLAGASTYSVESGEDFRGHTFALGDDGGLIEEFRVACEAMWEAAAAAPPESVAPAASSELRSRSPLR